MEAPSSALRKNALGYAGDSSVQLFLPSGRTLELSGGTLSAQEQFRVVSVSAVYAGKLSASRVTGSRAPGDLNLGSLRLGSLPVSPQVRIYDAVQSSRAVELSLDSLGEDPIPANRIAVYHCDSSGTVDFIQLENYTGDAYRYGKLFAASVNRDDGDTEEVLYRTVQVENGDGTVEWVWNRDMESRVCGGAVIGVQEQEGMPVALDVVSLKKVGTAGRADFFQKEEQWYVTVGSQIYPVSGEVQGLYGKDNWFTQEADRLETIRAYSDRLTLYVDPIGHKVRVIVAE